MHVVFSPPVVEFTTVATELCRLLEHAAEADRDSLVAQLLKLLPLLYAKAQLLPAVDGGEAYPASCFVSEDDYDWVRTTLAELFAELDDFEDVAYDEGVQTGELRWRRVSECLADIYQPLRNFLDAYRHGVEAEMEDALWVVADNFELYWGADVVDVMRRLHRVTYIDTYQA